MLIVLNYILSIIYWAAWMAFIVIQIRAVLVNNVGMALTEKFALSNAATDKFRLIQLYIEPPMVS
jgi:hypothetical protein